MCSRAVGVHAVRAPDQPVSMRLSDDENRFTVEVTDCGPLEDDPRAAAFGEIDPATVADVIDDDTPDGMPSGFGLVVIGGLVEELVVTSDEHGTHVKMAWPALSPEAVRSD
jgi:anti-sigma regulatory factor (Ser/Thr protein kinase)